MDREMVLAILALLLVGPLLLCCSCWPTAAPRPAGSARRLERARWTALWRPMIPVTLMVAFLLGWAAVEPDDAEPVRGVLFLAAAPFASIWLRALARAPLALRCPDSEYLTATVGLWRPRIVISEHLRSRLDGRALRAAHEHEELHRRHRDPLRIWLGQFATDLQWPSPRARARFESWRHALELARDEEVRLSGIEGSDLAQAVITAARLEVSGHGRACALLADGGGRLEERISRLLAPLRNEGRGVAPGRTSRFLAGGSLLAAAVLGATLGEGLVRALLLGPA